MKIKHLLFFLTLFIFSNLYAQIDCDFMGPVCSNDSFSGDAPAGNPGGSIDGGCSTLEADDVNWYFVKIQSGTTFTFQIVPDNPTNDYDFAVWLNPADCNNLGTADRASYSIAWFGGTGTTGLMLNEIDICETAAGGGNVNEMVRHLDVQPGDEIVIAIDRYENDGDGFTLEFNNGGDADLDCTILGKSFGKCDVDENGEESFVANDFTSYLNTDYPGNNYYYYYNSDDALADSGTQVSFPFTANLADNPTFLFVRIENSAGQFVKVVKILLFVNPLPVITNPISFNPICDMDLDGVEEFDLTEAESNLVDDPSQFTFSYYENLTDAESGNSNTIPDPTEFETGTGIVYVRVKSGPVEGNDEGCVSIGEIHFQVNVAEEPTFDLPLTYCLNSISDPLPTASDNGITGSWNQTSIDTSSVGTFDYTFTPNSGLCAVPVTIPITITDLIIPEFPVVDAICQNSTPPDLPDPTDSTISGTWNPSVIDTSQPPGEYPFTFQTDGDCGEDVTIMIEITEGNVPVEVDLPPSYCQGDDPIDLPTETENNLTGHWVPSTIDTEADPGTYTFTFYPDADQCASEEEFTIEIFEKPTLNILSTQEICDEDLDGIYETDLTQLNQQLSSSTTINYQYYASLSDFNNDVPILQSQLTNYIITSLPTTIYVIASSSEGCTSEQVEVNFELGDEVDHSSDTYGPIAYCINEEVDLTGLENTINGAASFTYYESQQDAAAGQNFITDPEHYTPDSSDDQVYIVLSQDDRCSVIVALELEELPTPSLEDLPHETNLCEGDQLDITVTSDDPDASFEWTDSAGNVLTGATQTFNGPSTYSVIAISSEGCESEPQILDISLPDEPVITGIEFGENSIIVTANNNSFGPLEYSLDGVLWQNSNEFINLVPGEEYTIYVRSGGCVITKYTTTLLDVPNFISPNADGYNDTWTIRGIEASPQSTIKIFDRYGKIFVDTNFEGDYIWDGKYGGRSVPSGDYWYILNVPGDQIVPPQKFVGHISIKNH